MVRLVLGLQRIGVWACFSEKNVRARRSFEYYFKCASDRCILYHKGVGILRLYRLMNQIGAWI